MRETVLQVKRPDQQHSALLLPFRPTASVCFRSPPNLQCRAADRHQTLPHVRRRPRFIQIRSKIGGSPRNFGARPNTSKFRRYFGQLRANISGTQQDIVKHCKRRSILHMCNLCRLCRNW